VSTQKLLEDISEAFANGQIEHWRSRFQKAMVLLIDDVHLAGSQPKVQEEVVRLLDSFVDSTRQVVVTINARPEEVEVLGDSLKSKLGAGLLVEIGPPDRGLRHVLVSQILTERLGSADQELSDYLADRPADSIRAVAGLVQRVITGAEESNVAVSAALARELTQGIAAPMRRSSSKARSSGVLTSPTGGIRSSEKIVWSWPIPEERLIEEFV
jgi:chromosomal replication initiator protein